MQSLASALRIHFASSRKNDFTGAHNYYDLWVFDEFHSPDPDNGSSFLSATESGTPFENTLFKMLDGQECTLDSKYSRVFTKKRNVPIIMIANQIPRTTTAPFKKGF